MRVHMNIEYGNCPQTNLVTSILTNLYLSSAQPHTSVSHIQLIFEVRMRLVIGVFLGLPRGTA